MPGEFIALLPGDPAPWFYAATPSSPRFAFNVAAGRYVVLFFYASAADPAALAALRTIAKSRNVFDDRRAALFGVSIDPNDRDQRRVSDSPPGLRFMWDFDRAISKAYGSAALEGAADSVRRFWIVLDPTLRVLKLFPFSGKQAETDSMITYVSALPPPDLFAGVALDAPVLYLPRVFEPELCDALVNAFEVKGGQDSGFMRDIDGKTSHVIDYSHKRRADHLITDPTLIRVTKERVQRRVAPEIEKICQFKATRIERSIVARYSAEDGGHFRPHRDNTTKGTAHRCFAVTINLNADFEGGELGFPEYGGRTYKPPVGGAVVFSCSLLHAVSKVTRGLRYAFLPFLYDEAAALLREKNNEFLDEGIGAYEMTRESS
ncbi:MAG: 2OG-Fe(II) oxygenase [Alphaproteobacteria bacterium]